MSHAEVSFDHHHIKLFRKHDNPKLGRAECSCGWSLEGEPKDVASKAACHDLDIPEETIKSKENTNG